MAWTSHTATRRSRSHLSKRTDPPLVTQPTYTPPIMGERMQERYVIDSKGKKTAVIVPLRDYQQLLEDLHDLAVVAERRDEQSISFEELQRRVKASGAL